MMASATVCALPISVHACLFDNFGTIDHFVLLTSGAHGLYHFTVDLESRRQMTEHSSRGGFAAPSLLRDAHKGVEAMNDIAALIKRE